MGAPRDLGERDEAGAGQRCAPMLWKFAGEGAGDPRGAGAVAGGEAGLLLGPASAGPRLEVLAVAGAARPGPVDAVLDQRFELGGEQVGRDHPGAGARHPTVAPDQAESEQTGGQGQHMRLVAKLAGPAGGAHRYALPVGLDRVQRGPVGVHQRLARARELRSPMPPTNTAEPALGARWRRAAFSGSLRRWRGLVIPYALALALAAVGAEWLEYRYVTRLARPKLYIALLAIGFIALGIWAGRRLTPRPAARPSSRATTRRSARSACPRASARYLALLASGQSNKEMARTLGISPNTMKTHVARVYEKLEVQKRHAGDREGALARDHSSLPLLVPRRRPPVLPPAPPEPRPSPGYNRRREITRSGDIASRAGRLCFRAPHQRGIGPCVTRSSTDPLPAPSPSP